VTSELYGETCTLEDVEEGAGDGKAGVWLDLC
jgi:hypothetical protein